jgi:tRNA-dihydrouridine synthase A
MPYAERHIAAGGRLNNIARHVLGLYHGRPRARAFRRHLSERAPLPQAGVEVLREAIRIAERLEVETLAAAE